MGDAMDFSQADIVFIGGGADREQMIVKDAMVARKSELSAYVADGGVLLAVCGGYQFLGHSYAMDDVVVEALGSSIWKPCAARAVLIGNAVIQSDILNIMRDLKIHFGKLLFKLLVAQSFAGKVHKPCCFDIVTK